MRIYETSTVDQLISIGKSIDMTYYKTSIHQIVQHIECAAKNIFYDYLDYIKQRCVIVELTNEEYHKYVYRPKLLAFDVYGSTDLFFIILMLNDINTEKDFNMKNVRLLRPSDIDILNKIYNAERKYLLLSSQDDENTVDTSYDDYNSIGQSPYSSSLNSDSYPGGFDESASELNEIRKEIQNIKITIRNLVEQVIDEEMTDIIKNQLDAKIEELKNILDRFVDGKLDDKIQELLKHIERVKEELEDKIDFEVDIIYEEFYLIRQEIKKIIEEGTGGGEIPSELLERLEQLERTVESLTNLIDSLINEKINDRLNLLLDRLDRLESMIPSNLESQLESLRNEINNILVQVENILSDNYIKIIQDIDERFKEFKEEIKDIVNPLIEEELKVIKEKIQNIIDRTRDIVFKIYAPMTLGTQDDTEFTIPYKGTLKQFIINIGRESVMTSNIIIKVQRYDDTLTIPAWMDMSELLIFANEYTTKIDSNISLNNASVRLVIESGDLDQITGITVIMRFLEDPEI